MIGQRVESHSEVPKGAVVAMLIGLVMLAFAGIFRETHFAMLAIMPIAIAGAMALTRPKPFAAVVTVEALECEAPPVRIAYSEIDGLVMRGSRQSQRAPIKIGMAGQVVHVPANLNVPSADLMTFLESQIAWTGPRFVNPALSNYLRRQKELFGAEQVFSYRARPQLMNYPYRRAGAVLLAMALASGIWIAIALSIGGKDYEPWFILGIVFAFLFGVFGLTFMLSDVQPRIRNWQSASLVVSPAGLALVQGDLRGELRWGEVQAVRFRERNRAIRFIGVTVAGATIEIADIYNRPITMIHDRIVGYWRGRDANA